MEKSKPEQPCEIRSQIFFKGSKNSLKQGKWDDQISLNWVGCPISHLSFVRQNHRNVTKYDQACEDIYAASYTLTKMEEYHNTGDQLFDQYYDCFQQVIKYGTEFYISQCKEILQFVKYPEGNELPYEIFKYKDLWQLAKYHSIFEYPKEYLMYYETINEFDLKLSTQDKKRYAFEYLQQYLSPTVYTEGDERDLSVFQKALDWMVKLVKPKTAKYIWDIIRNGPQYRLGKINNTYCKAGSKQVDFWIQLSQGIDPEIQEEVYRDFNRLNFLYKGKFEYPKVIPGGMKWNYHTQLIVQEDPKKPRFAFESNPIKDLNGYPGMDVLHALFQCWPWIQCGRKRESKQDMLLDKHRYEEIKKVYLHNMEKGREMKSSDLTKCTEHLNMRTGIQLVYKLLCLLKSRFTTDISEEYLEKWVQATFQQLYDTPIIVSQHEGLGLFYPKEGQTQGVPGSFHIMTFELAVANLQAAIDSGIKPADAMWSIQNNGDDGTGPEICENRYKELIEHLAQPGVYNEEKSFSTRINGSLEFCKTIYYSSNPELVTGYRFSTLYKLTNSVWELAYVENIGFEHEKHLFEWFTEYIHPNLDVNWDTGEYLAFKRSYDYLHDVPYRLYIQKLQVVREQEALDNMILSDQEIVPDGLQFWVPQSWVPLIRVTAEYTIEQGNTIIYSDIKRLRSYFQPSISGMSINNLADADQDQWDTILDMVGYKIGHLPINKVSIQEVVTGIDPCTINVFEPSDSIKVQLGLPDEAIVLIEPRVNWLQGEVSTVESILRQNEKCTRLQLIRHTIDEQWVNITQGQIITNTIGAIKSRTNK